MRQIRNLLLYSLLGDAIIVVVSIAAVSAVGAVSVALLRAGFG